MFLILDEKYRVSHCHWRHFSVRGFNNVFSERVTGFHRWAKPFDLNFFFTSICLMVKSAQQNHPLGQTIGLVPKPKMKALSVHTAYLVQSDDIIGSNSC